MDIVYVNSPASNRMFEKNLIVNILSDSPSIVERKTEYSQIQLSLSGVAQEIFRTYYFSALEGDSVMFSIDLPRLKEDRLITTAANIEFYLGLVSFLPTYATVLSATVWFNTTQVGNMVISTVSDSLITYTPLNVNISYTNGTTASPTTTPSPIGTSTSTSSSTTRSTTRTTTRTTTRSTSPIPTTPARSTSWWPTVTIPPITLSTTTAAPISVFRATTTTYTTTLVPTKTTRKPVTTFIGTPPPSGVLCPKPGYCKALNF